MSLKTKPDSPTHYRAVAGLDWGDGHHAVSLRFGSDTDSDPEQFMLESAPEKVHGWLRDLHRRTEGQPVAVALEMGKAILIEELSQHEFIDVYALNPITTSYLRKAFQPSGAKDDLPDSRLHLDIVTRHWDQLRLLSPRGPIDKQLDFLTKHRRKLADQSTKITNKLRNSLKDYYPLALEMAGDLDGKMASAFLKKWPTLATLKKSRAQSLRKFYHQSGSRSSEVIEKRLAKLGLAEDVGTDAGMVAPMRAYMESLVAQLDVLREQIEKFEAIIEEVYAEHPDREIWDSFPGSGPALSPRLAAAWGIERSRYQSAHDMQLYSGIAPVTEHSGKGKAWVHRRWSRPRFLHQTFWEYANQSVRQCDWAKAFLEDQKAKGKKHSTAMRSLAFKWQRIMHACWQSGQPYDDAQYQEVLARKGSKFATNKTALAA